MTSLARRLRSIRRDESGYTLIELVVALGIFAIFMTMLLTTVVSLARSSVRAQITSQATQSALVVFGQLDRQARYADAINFPGPSTGGGNANYIEFRTPGSSSLSGVTTCTQWRYLKTEGRIESRQWNDISGSVKTPWATKLTDVIPVATFGYPFKMLPVTIGGSSMQQLALNLKVGNASMNAGADLSTFFVARNSSISSPSNTDANNDKLSDTPVCLLTGNRP